MSLVNEKKYQEKFGNPITKSHSMDILIMLAIVIIIILIIMGMIRWL